MYNLLTIQTNAQNSDTASLLFQTNWSGRAEMGTAGSDDFVLKVSADGSTFREALRADGNIGAARFPNGMDPERRSIGGLTKGGGTDWWGTVDPFTVSYSTGSQHPIRPSAADPLSRHNPLAVHRRSPDRHRKGL